MNSEELNAEQPIVTPQERTGVKLLASFEPEIWVIVDGSHSHLPEAIGSGAGVIVLQGLSQPKAKQPQDCFAIDWQQCSYQLEDSGNSTEAEIWAAIKGLELVAKVAGQKRIQLISDNQTVSTLQTKLLVIELGLKNAHRYAKEMELSPLQELADLFLRSQPCQILSRQDLSPQGFNLILVAAHQAAHELANQARANLQQQLTSNIKSV
jgi:ribonuclease HI